MLPASSEVLSFVEGRPGLRTRDVVEALRVPEAEADDLGEILQRLQLEGEIVRVPGGGWTVAHKTPYRVGELSVGRAGYGFVRVARGAVDEEDIFIPPDDVRGALEGDIVLVRLKTAKGGKGGSRRGGRPASRGREGRGGSARGPSPRRGPGAQPGDRREGTIVDIVRRGKSLFLGQLSLGAQDGSVRLSGVRYARNVHIPRQSLGAAQDGERVLVRIEEAGFTVGDPSGRVVARLKGDGSYQEDLQVILALYELPEAFAPAIMKEVAALEAPDSGRDYPERVDLRGVRTFTIDPLTAEDFDDAVSIEALEDGSLRLSVHIADVSHYVRPGTALDREAEARGTSVYLPGHVVPMLPERISNDLSSLRPNEDRFAKTARLTYSAGGELTRTEVFRSLIRSQHRFTYEEVLALLSPGSSAEAGPGGSAAGGARGRRRAGTKGAGPRRGHGPASSAADFLPDLRAMARLRDWLHAARYRRGALYLDIPKLKLELDATGRITGLGKEERDPSHSLIEELMLAANEAVADYFREHQLPLPARVHPAPEGKKLADLKVLVRSLGYRLRIDDDSRTLQQLVEKTTGDPLGPVLQLGLLRTMGHAEYVAGHGLHFALATSSYCHFTSPIRRYPDLLVHQILDEYWDGRLASGGRLAHWSRALPHACARASVLERRAESAEREMLSVLSLRFLEPLVGGKFSGRILSVHPFGVFVRLDDFLVDGLIHVGTLSDDYYAFDREKLTLRGSRRGNLFKIGDRVRVELFDVDVDLRELSFRFLAKLEDRPV